MSELIIKPRDAREPRGGWAPGGYLCTCHSCKLWFTGDKRAVTCADCAYEIKTPTEEKTATPDVGAGYRLIDKAVDVRMPEDEVIGMSGAWHPIAAVAFGKKEWNPWGDYRRRVAPEPSTAIPVGQLAEALLKITRSGVLSPETVETLERASMALDKCRELLEEVLREVKL